MSNNLNIIHVKIGEIKLGSEGDLLKATLGSCVGIAFVWRKKSLFGLAHCLLPDSKIKKNSLGAKFVNQAIESLLVLFKAEKQYYNEIEVYFAGGGNMLPQLSKKNEDHIGKLNVDAAKKFLKDHDLSFKDIDSGGDVGRQIYLDCSTAEVTVKRLEKLS